ncbi:MAG: HAMP domain-containing histidine kinase [Acidobacteria bacterium]|nr:HAMP domain-containing histidine kinase [Acidobacteriota bacterium]MCA1627489.1 HAMP domain-containing histidine kinase [Acidobacteriota bacterium]
MLRSKSFLTCFVICAVPLLLLAALNYWNGTRSVNNTANTMVEDDLRSFNAGIDEMLRDEGSALLKLAVTPDLQRVGSDPSLRKSVHASLKSAWDFGLFQSLALFDHNRKLLWLSTNTQQLEIWDATLDNAVRSTVPQPDDRAWTAQGNVLFDRPVGNGADAGIEFSVPIHNENGLGNEGAIVAVVNLKRLFATTARALESSGNRTSSSPVILVRDSSGSVVYQSEPPWHGSGATASAPTPRLNVTIAATRYTAPFMSAARFWGVAGFILALGLAFLSALLLDQHVRRRSRGMAQVTEDLSAIAKGEWDRRIVLQSSDDARAIADNINTMTERLRAQIAREEESRQFESFVRISAMLTHDLKNAIEGLSLTVSNMERHFDNEQFRIDAMKGLTNACDKLKALVNRLSRPVSSLSGEHRRPTKTDLVPIINRVVAMTAEPTRGRHTIQTKLPANLYALADPARVEEVMENLILNAIEAMHLTSGTLTVEGGYDANGTVIICVCDTGPGMSRTFIENRLFRPFSTTKKHGIGLGLYTCREVIRASGGSIEVQSVEGAGTTFRVVLPSVPNDRRN